MTTPLGATASTPPGSPAQPPAQSPANSPARASGNGCGAPPRALAGALAAATFTIAVAAAGWSGSAHAQALQVVAERPVRAFVGFGLTHGGDRLITARYTDGSSYTLRGGGLLQLHAGAEFRLAPRLTMAASIGLHADAASAVNGSVTFRRYPLEGLAHYEFAPGWRVGGGVRLAIDPKLTSDRGFFGADQHYETAVGPVIEIEYRFNRLLGLKLRGVSERYKSKDGLPSVDGDHVGMFLNFYF